MKVKNKVHTEIATVRVAIFVDVCSYFLPKKYGGAISYMLTVFANHSYPEMKKIYDKVENQVINNLLVLLPAEFREEYQFLCLL